MTDPLRIVTAAWTVALGAAVGSFLNVVIARVPAGESVVRPRSRCPRCGAAIAWHDNLPVVSWLLLRGRCRTCRAPISPRYVVVEVLGAAAAFVAFRRHGLTPSAAVELAFVAFLLALAFIDLDRWELPHELTRPLLVLGLAASAVSLTPAPSLASSALGAAAGWVGFWAVRKIGAVVSKREAMGEGDVWLLAGLGAYLGAGALLPIVMLSSLQGSVVGVALLAAGKLPDGRRAAEGDGGASPPGVAEAAGESPADPAPEATPDDDGAWVPPKNAVPFGPFLVLAALEWLYLASRIVDAVPVLELFF